MYRTYIVLGSVTFLLTVILILITRAWLTHWRTVSAMAFFFMLGLMPYLLVPIFSMTNPPMNWGYPRTADGFTHLVTRGQFEGANPAENFSRFGECMLGYAMDFKRDYGMLYGIVALLPFVFLWRIQKENRRWLLGLLGLFLALSLFLTYLLNPSIDRASLDLLARFYTPSHLILSILAGCGLAILGLFLSASRRVNPTS